MSSNRTRTETDSLGAVAVPEDALYGAQTQRAIGNFAISGRTAHPSLTRAYLRLKSAAAQSNRDCGALHAPLADAIVAAASELLALPERDWPAIFPVDVFQAGAGTSQNMNVNEVIANWANRRAGQPLGAYQPVHPNDHVNASQSTNDSFPTAMRLALLEAAGPLARELRALAGSFAARGREWIDLPKSGRTHLQDAVPMRLGEEFLAYAATVSRCVNWIEAGRDSVRELGIGGSAAGTGLNVPDGYVPRIIARLEELTGERLRAAPNLYEAMQSQAPVMYYSGSLRLLALEMTRVCNDLRLLASGPMTGLAEILLPAVQPGSSIMPGKVNPSILEMANQAWYFVLGQDQAVAYAVQAGQLELNVMMPIMAGTLLEATRVATETARTLRERCVDGLRANEAKLRKYFESTPQVATALSPRLGYSATAKLVTESLATGKSVLDLVRERSLIPEAELRALADPAVLTGRRSSGSG